METKKSLTFDLAQTFLEKSARLANSSCLGVLFDLISSGATTFEAKEKLYMIIGNVGGEGVSLRDGVFV
jgi:hypothetical protein